MLSEAEYYTALEKYNNIPSDLHGTHRQNYQQSLKKTNQRVRIQFKI